MMKPWHNRHRWQLVLLLVVMASPAFAGTLIKSYGQFRVVKTPWTIDVSEHGLTVGGIALHTNTGIKESPPAPGVWKPHPGWFVFVDDSEAWAYDGADLVWVEVVTANNISSYTFAPHRDMAETWGVIPNPPKEVFDRLPPKIQAVIRQKFPEGH